MPPLMATERGYYISEATYIVVMLTNGDVVYEVVVASINRLKAIGTLTRAKVLLPFHE
jgi:hypothetical protein